MWRSHHQVNARPLARGASPGCVGVQGEGLRICAHAGFLVAPARASQEGSKRHRLQSLLLRREWDRDTSHPSPCLGLGWRSWAQAGPGGRAQVQLQGREVGAKPGHHQCEAVPGDSTLLPALTSGPFFLEDKPKSILEA